MGGVHKTCGNSGGVGGGYFCVQKMEIPERRGGDLREFPPWWGYGYFLELHIGKHLKEEHSLQPTNLQDQFTVLKKCCTKFDSLIYECCSSGA